MVQSPAYIVALYPTHFTRRDDKGIYVAKDDKHEWYTIEEVEECFKYHDEKDKTNMLAGRI